MAAIGCPASTAPSSRTDSGMGVLGRIVAWSARRDRARVITSALPARLEPAAGPGAEEILGTRDGRVLSAGVPSVVRAD
jgi:hypothetical protein